MPVSDLRQAISLVRRRWIRGSFSGNVASTVTAQVIFLVLGVANASIQARWLGPEGKGMVALALLLPGMLGLFLSGGIAVANVYYAGSRRLDVATLTEISLGFAIPTILVGFGLAAILAATGLLERLVPGVPVHLILLAMLGFPLTLVNGYFSSILQGLQRITAINTVNLIQGALMLSLSVLLIVGLQLSVAGAIVAVLGSRALATAVLGMLLRREGGVLVPRWNRAIMRKMLSFALRGHIGNVLQFFNYRLDLILVNFFINPAEVGIYTVSVRLAELLWNLPNAVGFVIFPKAAASKPEEMNKFTPRVLRFTLGLTTLGAVLLVFLGRPLIVLIYSWEFVDAFIPMVALLPGVILLGGAKVLTNEIAGRGYPQYNSATSGVALVLTVVLDLLLIPRLGVLGASLASTIAYTAVFVLSVGFYLIVSRRAENALQVQPVDG